MNYEFDVFLSYRRGEPFFTVQVCHTAQPWSRLGPGGS
jgi:hypothetical protein